MKKASHIKIISHNKDLDEISGNIWMGTWWYMSLKLRKIDCENYVMISLDGDLIFP